MFYKTRKMKDDIDYTEKIKTFNLLVGNSNEEIALNYLTLTNWDETQAAILYNKENKGADAKLINQNNANMKINPNLNPNIIPNFNDDLIIPFDYYNYDNQKINPGSTNIKSSKLSKYNECKIYTKGLMDGLKLWKVDNRGYFEYFKSFKNCIKLYNVFITNLKTNVGIIFLYNKSTINDAINILRNLNNNEQTKDLLNQRCVIHPMIDKCFEASDIVKKFKIKNFPVMIICFHKNEINFAVISVINSIMNNIPLLNEKLIEAHELLNSTKNVSPKSAINNKNNMNNINNNNIINNNPQNDLINNININNKNNIINNNTNNSKNILDDPRNYLMDEDEIKGGDMYPYMSDGDILKKQEEEMKSLERKEQEKIKKKKQEEEEKKRKEIEEKNKIESLIKQLPEEPNDDNPDKCIIMFRYPDGEKTVQRKFLRTDKISILYLYVKSLGREIYRENENGFSLVQPFPFKSFNDLQENTLEQEGMFPNAVLQIRTGE